MPEEQSFERPVEGAAEPAVGTAGLPSGPTGRLPGARSRAVCACPRCGDVALSPSEVRLVVCPSAPDRSHYQFRCPRCRALVTRQASERVVLGLSARGATVETLPLEALEPRRGVPLTVDDLLDLRLALRAEDVVARACSDARR